MKLPGIARHISFGAGQVIYLIEKTLSGKGTNHKRYDPVVFWETSELFTYLHFKSLLLESKISMPKAYSEDLRLRAVWLHFFLGYDTEETAGLLAMSVRSVERYLTKYVRMGELIAKKTGRPVDLVGMHPREELVMMEAVLEHPEKTLAEIVQEMLRIFGRHFHVSTICRYFQRNGVTRKKVTLLRSI